MTRYITNGVLVRLHYQKAGQHSSQLKAQAFVLGILCLVVIPLAIYNLGDGGKAPDAVYRIAPTVFGSLGAPPSSDSPASEGLMSSSDFLPTGFVGPVRIVAENRDPVLNLTTFKHPEPSPVASLALEVPSSVDGVGYTSDQLSTNSDFGLPDPPPMWTFTSRGLPLGVDKERIRSAQAILANPAWPKRAYLVDDTAIVEGWLTLHSYGLMSFELISETPPGQGFAAAVQTAVERSQCVPATDSRNNRVTVRCRYRCLFFHGGEPTVSVGSKVNARLR